MARGGARAYLRRVDDGRIPPAPLTIPDLDPDVTEALAARALRHGRTAEAEAGAILRDTLRAAARAPGAPRTGEELVAAILRRFGPERGVELELQPRETLGEPRVRFDW